jgi:hypothetical protein
MALQGTAFVGRRLGRRRSSSSRDGVPIPRRHSGAPRPPVPLAPVPPSCTGRSPPPHNARRGGAENTAASPSRRQSARRELPTPASPPTLAASRVRVAPRCRPLIAPALSATVHYRATPRGRRWVSALPASPAPGPCCHNSAGCRGRGPRRRASRGAAPRPRPHERTSPCETPTTPEGHAAPVPAPETP